MPDIGSDCDLILLHSLVNNGNPYGFVLAPDPSKTGPAISVQRSLDDDGEIQIYLFATVILADNLKNPDGSEHSDSRQTMYEMLLDFLEQTDNFTIVTFMGTYLGLGQVGHSATELHLVEASYISLKFANLTEYHAPVNNTLYFGSEWQPSPPNEDAFTWEASVWR